MNPYYGEMLRAFEATESLEKLASADDDATARDGSLVLAQRCDHAFARALHLSGSMYGNSTKEASAESMVRFALSLRETHQGTGVKTAATQEDVKDLVTKLATATFLDSVLTEQIRVSSAEEKVAHRQVQLLGREWAVHLLKGLLQ